MVSNFDTETQKPLIEYRLLKKNDNGKKIKWKSIIGLNNNLIEKLDFKKQQYEVRARVYDYENNFWGPYCDPKIAKIEDPTIKCKIEAKCVLDSMNKIHLAEVTMDGVAITSMEHLRFEYNEIELNSYLKSNPDKAINEIEWAKNKWCEIKRDIDDEKKIEEKENVISRNVQSRSIDFENGKPNRVYAFRCAIVNDHTDARGPLSSLVYVVNKRPEIEWKYDKIGNKIDISWIGSDVNDVVKHLQSVQFEYSTRDRNANVILVTAEQDQFLFFFVFDLCGFL